MTWVLLLSLLIKSSVVAGAGLACARFMAQRPVDRVDILRGAVCLLLALPVIMNVLPAMDLAVLPPLSPVVPPTGTVEPGVVGAAASGALTWPPSALMVGGLWLVGVVAVAGQLQLGLLTLHRWTRQADRVTCADWLAPLERLSPADRPDLVSSARVASPLSWGVSPGFIVIDPASLAERHAAPAILAHELAHLRRHDWVFLVLSRLALAVFWFNPLVWRLHAVLAERSEEAADAAALETVDRTLYAKTLVRLAAYPIPRAATAMAADARTLKTRIACIMTNTSARRRPFTVALTVAALAVVATPLAAVGLSHQAWIAPPAPPAPPAPMSVAPLPPMPPAPQEPMADVPPVAPVAPVPPAPPAPPAELADGYRYSYIRTATPAERQAAADARAQAADARAQAAEARAQADEARRVADEVRIQADHARRLADASRMQADIARQAAGEARIRGEQARIEGERARAIGERAREEAARHMVKARAQMAQGADQMRRSARELRAEAVRLSDADYRAKQIAENRARGNVITDAELREVGASLPAKADDLERQAEHLAAEARKPT
jgi:beta-lactamase regulating signal transducer with metallopeptidase domain